MPSHPDHGHHHSEGDAAPQAGQHAASSGHDHSGHDHSGHDHSGHDHGGTGKYIVVFVALCVLTTASILTTMPWWQKHVPHEVSWALMMTVSCIKALLVILFFMHLIWEASWKWVLTIPAACMSLFLVLMLVPDVGLRTRHYDRERDASSAYPMTQGAVDQGHGTEHDAGHADEHGSGHHEESGSGVAQGH